MMNASAVASTEMHFAAEFLKAALALMPREKALTDDQARVLVENATKLARLYVAAHPVLSAMVELAQRKDSGGDA